MSIVRLALAALITLGLAAPAGAGGRVDWSDYIDPNPSKPVHVAPAKATPDAPARTKKASRAKKKIGKASRKSKASAKARKKKKARR